MKQNNIEDNYHKLNQTYIGIQSNLSYWCVKIGVFQETSFNVKFLKQEFALFLEKERI